MSEDKEEQPQPEIPVEQVSRTQHRVRINGQEISYTATAGTLLLREEVEEGEADKDGHKPRATIFYVAYTRDGIEDLSRRPVTFSFNGGPGSSSVWLHLGVLGPRRVALEEDGQAPPPPYRLEDNPLALLDVSDLVFIDPVGTGFSRAVPGEKPAKYHEIQKDIEAVGEFIRLYATRNARWASPKFLIGESYGTTRAAGLAGHLQDKLGLFLNGIMLVSSVLNFQTISFDPGNDLPYVLYLPSYAATAWYHGRLTDDLQQADLAQVLAEAEGYASGEYLLALMKGDNLPPEERAGVVENLSRLTGLDPDYMERTNLRVPIMRFVKELLRGQRRTVGRLDSRFTGIDRDAAGENFEFDPSYAAVHGPFAATLNDYLRTELAFESDLPYEILTERVLLGWKYEKFMNQYVNVGETLRSAMATNPHLRVFVANGFYDLATPYFATRYTFDHLGLDADLRGNVVMVDYPAGHMMYIHEPSLAQMKKDLAAFIRRAMPAQHRASG